MQKWVADFLLQTDKRKVSRTGMSMCVQSDVLTVLNMDMTFTTWRSFLTQNRRTQFFCDTDRISSGCSLAATQQRWVSSLCVSSPREGKTLLQHSTACWEKEMEHAKELRDNELKNNKNNNKIKGSAGSVAHTRISSNHKGGWDRVTVRPREPQLETLSQRNKGRRCRGGEPS